MPMEVFKILMSAPMPQRPLRDYMEFQVEYLQHMVKSVPAGEDLASMLCFVTADGKHGVTLVDFGDAADRDRIMSAFRALLQEVGAVQYSVISAAWELKLDTKDTALLEQIAREGTAKYANQRKEIYHIVSGDKTETLQIGFDVTRDASGKITGLTRKLSGPHGFSGRMWDLLRAPPAVLH